MRERLKDLKVEKKLQSSYFAILGVLVLTLIVAIGGIVTINGKLNSFYKESYRNTQLQLEIRKDIQMVGKNVLWAVTMEDQAKAQEKIDVAATYAGYVGTNVEALGQNFDNEEMSASLLQALGELKESRGKVVGLVTEGKYDEALELFNGEYTQATDKIQNILIEIGNYSDQVAESAYKSARILGIVANIIMILVGIMSIALCMKFSKVVTSLLVEPILELQGAAQKLKRGELDIEITYKGKDELGELAENFRGACQEMNLVIEDAGYLLSMMAEGNFNIKTRAEESYVGDFRLLIDSMRKLNRQLDGTLRQISEASEQVSVGAGQLASSAQELAEGATEQAGAVEELTATVEDVTNIAEESAEGALKAAEQMKTSAKEALTSREEMNQLIGAMERITDTSREIENIIGAIEDIASQTNLLSLNASIEAARAGEAGKGFAVVADQIGKLASDSAQSAVTTRELISKSLEEIENGNEMVHHTMEVIGKVLVNIEAFAETAVNSAEGSRTQADMLKQVEAGIEQISTVVQSNSAAAEETSAISEELSAQAENLEEMVSAFELRKD